ncbi:MAG: DUF1631 family protein [Hahellaceae bacterium]|nr:DUF1631 family protein [Hahellaceae bacterium]MCP5170466.1 DUF1631 family protein [Hahellaceae bacterium]
MERRVSLRHPIHLHARLSVAEGETWPCIISDFCAEGLFIKYDPLLSVSIQNAVKTSAQLKLQVSFRDPLTQQSYLLNVHPARIIEGAMGVSLMASNLDAIGAMLSICGMPTAQPATEEINISAQLEFILRQCKRAVIEHIRPLLASYFPMVDEALIRAAEVAVSDQISNEILKSASVLKANKEIILARLDESAGKRLSMQEMQKYVAIDGTSGALSLIEKSEFEDWLMFRVMVTKAETQYRGPLLQLKMRLDKLGVASHSGGQNPLSPAIVVNAFRDALASLNLSHCADKTVYRTFENVVLKDLDELYEELNKIFIQHKVLPDLDLSKYVTKSKSTESQAQDSNKPEAPKPEVNRRSAVEAEAAANDRDTRKADTSLPPNSPSLRESARVLSGREPATAQSENVVAQENLQDLSPPFASQFGGPQGNITEFRDHQRAAQSAYQAIRGLFARLDSERKKTELGMAKAAPDTRPSLTGEELNKSLEELQRLAALQSESYDADAATPLVERLQQSAKEVAGGDRKVSSEHETSLDVVDRFFASLNGSQKLTDTTKQQLKRLEVPLAKVLIRDRNFFEKIESPVRAVLNRIALLGVKGGRPNPIHQKKVDQIVMRINENFDQDTGIFDDVLHELDELIERQNLVYRRNVERVTAAAEGEQKVGAAKEAVAREIEKRIAGKRVAKAIVTLINGGWQDLLALTCIRQGIASQLWQDYLDVLDTLLSFAEDPGQPINLPSLLRIIQDGLSTISSNQIPSALIRDELKKFLMARSRQAMEMVDVPAVVKTAVATDDDEIKGKGLQRWIARVQKLKPGDWMRYQKAGEAPQYMRLVWIAKGHSRFVFVNHQGMKVVALDQQKLARYLFKEIVVLDPGYEMPIVDEGLDNMVKKVYGQLSWIATHDALTGLANRKEFERAVTQVMLPEQENRHWTVMHLDVRGFRLVNDSAGYEGGDHLLKNLAKLFKEQTPSGALVARLHGNEFAMLIGDGDGDAAGLAEHLVDIFQEYRFSWKNVEYEVGLNVGIAESGKVLSNAGKLLKAASDACRDAKRQGNNRIEYPRLDESVVFQQEQITAKVAGMGDLNEERILLRCQKIIPLQPDTRVGTQYEILLSIYDDRGQLIPAGEFVRTAEKYNRMQAVDRWVVGYVLDWMAMHQNELNLMGGISINLSGHSLNDAELLEFIYDRLSMRNAPLEKLWFEITEAAAIANVADVAEFMSELKEIGCRFCLGNFGAGMSSYQFLKELPVDMIKIDGTFVKDLATDENDRAMVRSMAEMVHFMGKEIIAAQVEDKHSLEALKTLGVDYAQGYVIERPRLISSF